MALSRRQANEQDFNPRSREGSDRQDHRVRSAARISIHAPVKGATFLAVHQDLDVVISIHAPVKGATR